MADYIKLYFLDDGSLIIDDKTSTTLIPSDRFEISIHHLSNLGGKEAYDFVVAERLEVVKNELSNCSKSLGTGNKKTE